MKKIGLIAPILLALGLCGCYNDNKEALYPTPQVTCDTVNVTFTKDVMPILTTYCNLSGCHNATGVINFTTYEGIKPFAASSLLPDINWTGNPMPKNGAKLSDCNIKKITRWVNQGAPNN